MPPLRNNTFVNNITEDERPDPVRIFLVSLLSVCVFVGLVFYGASFYFSYKSKMALSEIANIEKRLESLPLTSMQSLSKKIITLDDIQKSEINIPLFLEVLGDSIEKNTYITSMSYANKGKNTIVKIVGNSNSYEEIVRQMDSFKKSNYSNLISKVELISISATEIEGVTKVLFSMDISIDPFVRAVLSAIEEKPYDPSKQIKKEDIKKIETISTTTSETNIVPATTTNKISTSTIPVVPISTITIPRVSLSYFTNKLIVQNL